MESKYVDAAAEFEREGEEVCRGSGDVEHVEWEARLVVCRLRRVLRNREDLWWRM